MIQLMAVMVPLVFLINGFTKHDWKSAFFFAMAVAVGLTPEMLPMIVSVCLSKGAIAMSRRKVIVKRLNAIQNFGGMDVLCTDKTGTLTEDRVVLQRHCDVAGRETDEVLLDGYLISHFQTGLKNLLDTAILGSADFHQQALIEEYKKLDEIPFDFTRRMMSVLVQDPEGHAILLTKGAPEEIFHQCSQFELDGKMSPMDPQLMKGLKDEYASLSNDGFRVLAVARKELQGKLSCSKEDECDLVLKGYVAFLDPPKRTAAAAIEALHKHGVGVKILTGDNDLISRKVCGDVGLLPDPMLLGDDVEKMSDAELADAAEKTTLFARLSPAHKQRIVRVLRGKGHVVGFMGDGINRCARVARRGHRHLGGYGCGHRQRVGGSHPAGERSHGARWGCDRGAEGLRQHYQVHPDGSQFELWQHVQRAGRERLSPIHPDGSHSNPDQQHALRLLAGADSHGRSG
jgi:Mg2+-importing ATPase